MQGSIPHKLKTYNHHNHTSKPLFTNNYHL
jgi:hypothetical protein